MRLVLDNGLVHGAVVFDSLALVLGAELFLPLLGPVLLDGGGEGLGVIVDGVERCAVGPVLGSVANDRSGIGDLVSVAVSVDLCRGAVPLGFELGVVRALLEVLGERQFRFGCWVGQRSDPVDGGGMFVGDCDVLGAQLRRERIVDELSVEGR